MNRNFLARDRTVSWAEHLEPAAEDEDEWQRAETRLGLFAVKSKEAGVGEQRRAGRASSLNPSTA